MSITREESLAARRAEVTAATENHVARSAEVEADAASARAHSADMATAIDALRAKYRRDN